MLIREQELEPEAGKVAVRFVRFSDDGSAAPGFRRAEMGKCLQSLRKRGVAVCDAVGA